MASRPVASNQLTADVAAKVKVLCSIVGDGLDVQVRKVGARRRCDDFTACSAQASLALRRSKLYPKTLSAQCSSDQLDKTGPKAK